MANRIDVGLLRLAIKEGLRDGISSGAMATIQEVYDARMHDSLVVVMVDGTKIKMRITDWNESDEHVNPHGGRRADA